MKKKTIRLNEAQLKKIIKESVERTLQDMGSKQSTERKAQMIYDKLMSECPNGYNDWEMEIVEEDVDGPYTFYGYYYADYEDENGGTWHFEVGCSGYSDALVTEVNDTSEVEFESPDGIHGIVYDR